MNPEQKYHCCATCRWFHIEKDPGQPSVKSCIRLGFETKPHYQFNCWDPREDIKKRIAEESS